MDKRINFLTQQYDIRSPEGYTNLTELIQHLSQLGYEVRYHDCEGDWAEFNCSADISKFILGTKAETLSRLKPLVKESYIASQVSFTINDWIMITARNQL